MRKLELSWLELEELLQAKEMIIKGEKDSKDNEEIKEITLMKPRKIRIYLEGRR